MARLDFRLVPDLTPLLVRELLREHLDIRGFKDIEIVELGSAPLAKASSTSRVRSLRDRTGDGGLWNGAPRLSDGSFKWAGRGSLWRVCPANAGGFFRRKLRRFESLTGPTKTFAWMTFYSASSFSAA
jgi:hypothetical protein